MIWPWILLGFFAGTGVCYWKRAVLYSVLPMWHRPAKEPVDDVADRLDSAAQRLEAVTAQLRSTVEALQQNGATASDVPSPRRT